MSNRTASADFAQGFDNRPGNQQPAEITEPRRADSHSRTRNVPRQTVYWGATGLVATVALSAAFAYLTAAPQAIENFRHVGYPQQLRVLLGMAKLGGAIVLLVPRLPRLKEWAYAGFTFMWIAATVAHYLAGDKPLFLLPIALIALLMVSYRTRAASRRLSADAIAS